MSEEPKTKKPAPASYRVLAPCFIHGKVQPVGALIDFDGVPGSSLALVSGIPADHPDASYVDALVGAPTRDEDGNYIGPAVKGARTKDEVVGRVTHDGKIVAKKPLPRKAPSADADDLA